MWAFEQARPQPPQADRLVGGTTSQPSVSVLPLPSRKPASHGPLRTPAAQLAVTWLVEQPLPQALQFAGSLLRSTSHPSLRRLPLQSANPVAHPPEQAPAVQ